mgnify:CR=1 FL=1
MIATTMSEGTSCPPIKRNGALARRANGTFAWAPQKVVDDPETFKSKGFWCCPCNEQGRPNGRPFWAVVREVGEVLTVSNWRRDLLPLDRVRK